MLVLIAALPVRQLALAVRQEPIALQGHLHALLHVLLVVTSLVQLHVLLVQLVLIV